MTPHKNMKAYSKVEDAYRAIHGAIRQPGSSTMTAEEIDHRAHKLMHALSYIKENGLGSIRDAAAYDFARAVKSMDPNAKPSPFDQRIALEREFAKSPDMQAAYNQTPGKPMGRHLTIVRETWEAA